MRSVWVPIACGVAYYGGGIAKELSKTPNCPMLYHFGGKDTHIPESDIDQIRDGAQIGLRRRRRIAAHAMQQDELAAAAAACRRHGLADLGEVGHPRRDDHRLARAIGNQQLVVRCHPA